MGDELLASTTDLTKRFGHVTALDRVSVDVPRGQIIGLLGPNGAGKTTLLRTLMGLYVPDGGSATTLGVRSRDIESPQLNRVGYIDQQGGLLPRLTVRRHLEFYATFYDQWDWDYVERFPRCL